MFVVEEYDFDLSNGFYKVVRAFHVISDSRVAVNILNKQLRTADKGWSSTMAVGRGANISSP